MRFFVSIILGILMVSVGVSGVERPRYQQRKIKQKEFAHRPVESGDL